MTKGYFHNLPIVHECHLSSTYHNLVPTFGIKTCHTNAPI